MRVRWEDVDQETYDDMVSVLLYRIHPDAERVDGKGGDEGRDLYLNTPDGQCVFQLKSFTGRMTTSRRAQVKRSLKRAQQSNPAEWTMVVPIDPTPGESRWFEKLRGEASCPLVWRGRTWLDKEMSARPEIYRYFLNDADKEVMSLLRELNEGQAALSDVHEATKRMRALHERLNEIDPFYGYDLTTGIAAASPPPPGTVLSRRNGDIRVDVHPKYRGAVDDRPITAKLEFVFGPEDAELKDNFLRALDYGTAVSIPSHAVHQVKIDAPGGLGATFSGGSVELGESKPLGGEVAISAEIRRGEELLASLPMTLHARSRGQKGGIFDASDRSGCVRAEVTVDLEEHNLTATFHPQEVSLLPSALLPAFRWMNVFHSPHELVLCSDDGFRFSTKIPETTGRFVDDELLQIVEALDEIQRTTGVYFDTPGEFTADDTRTILETRTLLAGDPLEGTWSCFELDITLREGLDLTALMSAEGTTLRLERDETLVYAGHNIPLGRIRMVFATARFAQPEILEDARARGERKVSLDLVPGTSSTFVRQRIDGPRNAAGST